MGVGRVRGFVRGVLWGGVSGIAGLAVVSQLAGTVALQSPLSIQNTQGAVQLQTALPLQTAVPQAKAHDAGASSAEGGAEQQDWDKIAPIPMPIAQPAKLPDAGPQTAAPAQSAALAQTAVAPETAATASGVSVPDPAAASARSPQVQVDEHRSGLGGDPYVPPDAMAAADAKANIVPMITPITPLVPAAVPDKLSELARQAEPAFVPAVEPVLGIAAGRAVEGKDALGTPDGVEDGRRGDVSGNDSGNSLSNGIDLPQSAPAAAQAMAQDKPVAAGAHTAPAVAQGGANESLAATSSAVGNAAQAAAPSAVASGMALEQDETAGQEQVSQPVPLSVGGALQRYSRSFANLEQKPLFTILLIDDGSAGVDRAGLAAQDVPLTIMIDAAKPEALAHAKIWRAGGQEVVLSGAGLPSGLSGPAYGAALKSLAESLPEALALVDPDGRTFQNDLGLAAEIVPVLAKSGRGLVTLDQGANPADQSAKREGLPHGRIFRKLDVDGEAAEVVARYLDRAAFKAAQEGRVAVLGHVRPETVAGIMQWAVEGRAASVALAPLSALLAK